MHFCGDTAFSRGNLSMLPFLPLYTFYYFGAFYHSRHSSDKKVLKKWGYIYENRGNEKPENLCVDVKAIVRNEASVGIMSFYVR